MYTFIQLKLDVKLHNIWRLSREVSNVFIQLLLSQNSGVNLNYVDTYLFC